MPRKTGYLVYAKESGWKFPDPNSTHYVIVGPVERRYRMYDGTLRKTVRDR